MLPSTDIGAATVVQRAWRVRSSRRLAEMRRAFREMSVCSVCGDECVLARRCPNTHPCCMVCSLSMQEDSRCPLCREECPPFPDLAFSTLLHRSRARMRCGTCSLFVEARACDSHRAWCPGYLFSCPASRNCATASTRMEMGTHALLHHGALSLPSLPASLFVALSRADAFPFLMVGEGGTMVSLSLTVAITSRMGEPSCVRLHARGVYPSPSSPLLHAVVRQIRTKDEEEEWWWEEHRIEVRPLLSSRELVEDDPVSCPILVPKTFVPARSVYEGEGRKPFFLLDHGKDGEEARRQRFVQTARLKGARPPPFRSSDPMCSLFLLHVLLRQDGKKTVGETYPS